MTKKLNPYSNLGLTAKLKGGHVVLGYIDLHLTIQQANEFLSYLKSRSEFYYENLQLITQLQQEIDNARAGVASRIEKELNKIE